MRTRCGLVGDHAAGLGAETALRKHTVSVVAAARSAAKLRAPSAATYNRVIAVAAADGRSVHADAPNTPMNLYGDYV